MAIYFIQETGNPAGPIKIGFTDRPVEERLTDIQPCSPVRLSILRTIEGDTAREAGLHRRFTSFRLHGEWFSPDQSLLDFINNPDLPEATQNPNGFYLGIRTHLKTKLAEAGRDVSAEWIRAAIIKRYGVKIRFDAIYSIINGKPKDISRDHLGYICNVLGYTVEEVTAR